MIPERLEASPDAAPASSAVSDSLSALLVNDQGPAAPRRPQELAVPTLPATAVQGRASETPGPTVEPRATDRQDLAVELRRIAVLLGLVAAMAALALLRVARDFLEPIFVAGLLGAILRPVVVWLTARRVPRPLAALLVVAATLGALVVGLLKVVGPARVWLARAPGAFTRLEAELRWVKEPARALAQVAQRVGELAGVSAPGPRVQVQPVGALWELLGAGQRAGVQAFVVLVLLFFVLGASDNLGRRLARVLPRGGTRDAVVACLTDLDRDLSKYLSTISAINFCLGAAVSFSLWLIGMPNPVLWGVMLGVLNFVPYLGAPLAISIIAAVGLVSLDDPITAVAAPLVVAGLSLVESYGITPIVVGRSLALGPAAVFVALTFWTFLWGLPGAVIAVPTLMALKVVLTHVPGLAPLARLLGGRESPSA